MIVHLLDGTYELFRHFYGLRRAKQPDPPLGAAAGVLRTVLQMLEGGATHVGVATDHVIESFRNSLWQDEKPGDGIEPALLAQFHPLEEALAAMGVVVWPMVEFEADDALAAGAHFAAQDERVEKVCIWTPDKDLSQCVVGQRVVQIDRRAKQIRDEQGVRAKFGVRPDFIPHYLALIGNSADGYPGIGGLGPRTAATLINRYGPIEKFPSNVLVGDNLEHALLFKHLATLRTDAPLFEHSLEPLAPDAEVIHDIEQLRWQGPTKSFAAMAEKMGDPTLTKRVKNLSKLRTGTSSRL